MGYDARRLEIVAHVSRHNSPKDDRHDELWEDLMERIQAIVDDPKYQEIRAWVV